MKVYVHVLLQLLGFVAQAGMLITHSVPPSVKPYVILAVSAAQGFLAWYNHYYTPDGQKIQGA